MPVRSVIHGSEDTLFITFTCFQWLPLIELTNGYDLVYKWFNYLKSQGHLVVGYVVMPNHVHSLIYFSKTAKAINKIIGDGKRFMAYEIVKRLKEAGRSELLERLQNAVEPKDAQRGKKHEVWEDSFDSKICRTEKIYESKTGLHACQSMCGQMETCQNPH